MSYFCEGIEKELAAFIDGDDLKNRSSIEKTEAMFKALTSAKNDGEIYVQHGGLLVDGKITIAIDSKQGSILYSASQEISSLHSIIKGNEIQVICNIPVMFTFTLSQQYQKPQSVGVPAP